MLCECAAFCSIRLHLESAQQLHYRMKRAVCPYGPVLAIAAWDREYKEPIYLVTNMELADEAYYWYSKRYRIETFFSDEKKVSGSEFLKSGGRA